MRRKCRTVNSKRLEKIKKVFELMKTKAVHEVDGVFVEGKTTRVLSGTIYAHKKLIITTEI